MSQNSLDSEILFFKGVFICDLLEIDQPYSIEDLKTNLESYQREISSEKHELRKSFERYSTKLRVIMRTREQDLDAILKGCSETDKTKQNFIPKSEDKIEIVILSITYIRSGITKKMSVTTNSIDPYENSEGDFSIKPVTTNHTVIVPPGARDGDEICRYHAKGDQELNCRRGDLVFKVVHALPSNLMIKGGDIHYTVTIKEEEEKNGFEIEFPFYFEKFKKRFEPAEIVFEQRIKIGSGKGILEENVRKYGDLFLIINKVEKSITKNSAETSHTTKQ